MAIVYIEPRPKGRAEGTAIEDYAVETATPGPALKIFITQQQAVDWAKAAGHSVLVPQIRNADKTKPDQWQEA